MYTPIPVSYIIIFFKDVDQAEDTSNAILAQRPPMQIEKEVRLKGYIVPKSTPFFNPAYNTNVNISNNPPTKLLSPLPKEFKIRSPSDPKVCSSLTTSNFERFLKRIQA